MYVDFTKSGIISKTTRAWNLTKKGVQNTSSDIFVKNKKIDIF